MALATPNSWKVAVMGLLLLGESPIPAAQTNDPPPGPGALAMAAQKDYLEAQARHRQAPEQIEAAWQFGRACFDRAEFATSDSERAQLAEQGIAACRQALTHASNSVALHYYLGLDLGQLARTEMLGALKLVRQMEREFTIALALDEHFDYGGPDRCLGLLYRDAPALGSIGSRSKAREHLQRALELAPDYPENRLNLLESEWQWGEQEKARQDLTALEELWTAAHQKFSGPAWAASWADWEPRFRAAKRKIEDPTRKLETPRH